MLLEKQARFQGCLINSPFTLMIFILWTTYWAWCWVLSNFWGGVGGALCSKILTMKGEVPRALCFFPFFSCKITLKPLMWHIIAEWWLTKFHTFFCNHLAIQCRHSQSWLLNGAIDLHRNDTILGFVDMCVTWGCLPPSHKELFEFVNHRH